MEIWAETKEDQARYWNCSEATHWLVHQEHLETATPPADGYCEVRTMPRIRRHVGE